MAAQTDRSSELLEDSDEDFDWEEVSVPADGQLEATAVQADTVGGPSKLGQQSIEITLRARPKVDDSAKKRAAVIHAQRMLRLACHKMHTILLLGNAIIRNRWINDDLLKARLMSLTPMNLQNAFAMIHKSRIPETNKRGRMFESAMTRLIEWWYKTFTVLPTGHIRSRTYEDVQKQLAAKAARESDRKGKGRARDSEDDDEDEDEGELIRGEKSLMKHALMRKGSRDVSAQLFTSLCRALGIPARLVVSLQSVPWQANAGKPKKTARKKAKKADDQSEQKADDEDSEMEEVDIPYKGSSESSFPGDGQTVSGSGTPISDTKGKGKQKAKPVINLRKSRGRKLGSAPVIVKPARERTPEPTRSAPVFWTEVFSRADSKWFPVDPVRFIINKPNLFDPSSSFNTLPGTRIENRLVYVVAFEEDGYARDVTPRYASEFGAKTAKVQQGGKGKQDWWERVMAIVRRPYRLNRDDIEDDELHAKQMSEQMPNSMAGFKNHPLYVLERHLKRDEVIHPLVELGKFRGEPVYSRSSVVALKTAENWMRQGRKVREGCQPMKWVKQHAATVNKKRAVEMAMADRTDGLSVAGGNQDAGFSSERDVMQGMYAENQTELYEADPVVNGKVPKNDFGNIDLYVPSMLPSGGAYVPYKGVAKIARQLGIDYAEAVTGFEFKKQRAFPVISGIVVAAENEEMLIEAYWVAEREAEEKRRNKRQEQVIKRWIRLVQGLRIRQRLQEQYAGKEAQPSSNITLQEEQHEAQEAGGFINTADDVVQAYTLPRTVYGVSDSPQHSSQLEGSNADSRKPAVNSSPMALPMPLQMETFDIDDVSELELERSGATSLVGAPKTMRELAEAVTERQVREVSVANMEDIAVSSDTSWLESPSSATLDGKRRPHTRASTTRTTTVPAKPTPLRGRKRNRREVDSDSEDKHTAIVGKAGRGNKEGETANRSRRTSITISAPIPASDRVLRTRKSKTAAQVQQEREQETAYRRAIA